jgi:hypothetical protein
MDPSGRGLSRDEAQRFGFLWSRMTVAWGSSSARMAYRSIAERFLTAVTRGMSEWIVLFVTVYQWPGALPLYTATSVGPQDLSWVPHTTL